MVIEPLTNLEYSLNINDSIQFIQEQEKLKCDERGLKELGKTRRKNPFLISANFSFILSQGFFSKKDYQNSFKQKEIWIELIK